MKPGVLPILVPGVSNPIEVPCRLPESFDFRVFLPSRGVRTFTCWLTSVDPLKAEVKDVQLANREGDPRAGLTYEVDADEKQRVDEAASDVLGCFINELGLHTSLRGPIGVTGIYPRGQAVLMAIAKAWQAEEEAVSAGSELVSLFYKERRTGAEDIDKRIPNLTSIKGQDGSAACEALRCYVDAVVDAAVLAQSVTAERQAVWHEHINPSEDAPGSERCRNERTLDAATLAALVTP